MKPEVGKSLLEIIRLRLSKEAVCILIVSDNEGCSISSNLATTEAVAGALSSVAEEHAKNCARGAYG